MAVSLRDFVPSLCSPPFVCVWVSFEAALIKGLRVNASPFEGEGGVGVRGGMDIATRFRS